MKTLNQLIKEDNSSVKLSPRAKNILGDILNAMQLIRQASRKYIDAFDTLHDENDSGKITDEEHVAIIDAIAGLGDFDDTVFGENPGGESIYSWIDKAKARAQKLK